MFKCCHDNVLLFSRLIKEQPNHPLVTDMGHKADLFDQAASKFTVPMLVDPAA
jgi:hypothetical protein